MGGGGSPVIEQDGFRWYDDDNTDEDATTALAAEDTSYEVPFADLGTSHHLRIVYSNTGTKQGNDAFTIQYNVDGAGWNNVTTTSSNVRVIAGQPTDGAVTSQRLGAGTGSFAAGEYDDVDGSIDANLQNGDYTESVWSIEFRSADLSGGESIDIRMNYGGATVTENITINATIGNPVTAESFIITPRLKRLQGALLQV